ncbi:zinc finger protein 91 [Nematostella vectensis]|uniref:zinc finger protein 91 n=1 Tax=Nematostella vectensis TaxID=45351 RepID=UPI00207764B6|nr:zinc finger protein 91 [Nematostella vectensis]XP_048580814.1 zinc finger protein 91 [Nematostella vectensis]
METGESTVVFFYDAISPEDSNVVSQSLEVIEEGRPQSAALTTLNLSDLLEAACVSATSNSTAQTTDTQTIVTEAHSFTKGFQDDHHTDDHLYSTRQTADAEEDLSIMNCSVEGAADEDKDDTDDEDNSIIDCNGEDDDDDSVAPMSDSHLPIMGLVQVSSHSPGFLKTGGVYKCPLCVTVCENELILQEHIKMHKRKNKHYCNYCAEVFAAKARLQEHVKSMHPYTCIQCQVTFSTELEYTVHKNDCNSHYSCDECGKVYKTAKLLRNHAKIHNKQRFPCPQCDKVFSSKGFLAKHEVIHSDQRPHVCMECGKNFKMACQLAMHSKKHTNADHIHECSTCQKTFEGKLSLISHIKSEHPEFSSAPEPVDGTVGHSCPTCDRVFQTNANLERHQASHSEERPYTCSQCDKAFKAPHYLALHMKSHSMANVTFVCSVCDKEFRSKTALINHQVKHLDERPFTCSECGQAFKRFNDMNIHLKTHTSGDAFKCNTCDKRFCSAVNLNRHMLCHNQERPYACDDCDRAFKRPRDLETHSKAQHANVDKMTHSANEDTPRSNAEIPAPSPAKKPRKAHTKPKIEVFKCTMCGSVSQSAASLCRHLKSHPGDPIYECTHCDRKFAHEFLLTRHQLNHSANKPLRCDRCSKVFETIEQLQEHRTTHRSLKQNVCPHCGKGFLTYSKMMRHVVVHSDLRPHKCPQCSAAFKIKDQLARHAKVHTREKQTFTCEECDKVFEMACGYRTHMRFHSNTMTKSLKCSHCDEMFPTRANLIAHHKEVQAKGNFKCEQCDKSLLSQYYLKRHLLTHTRSPSCASCKETFDSKENLDAHVNAGCPKKKPQETYTCEVCDKGFSRVSSYKTHFRYHSKDTLTFKCSHCNETFSNRQSLIEHHREVTAEGDFKCDVCEKCFITKAHLKTHKVVHTRQPRCSSCKETFDSKENLKQHSSAGCPEKSSQEKEAYTCQVCDKVFSRVSSYKTHFRYHSKNSLTFKCSHCNETFSNRQSLIKHQREVTAEGDFKCDVCEKCFITKAHLKTHKVVHTRQPRCSSCKETFDSKENLKQHSSAGCPEKSSQKEEAYTCQVCDKVFSRVSSYKTHVRFHSKDTTGWKCHHCDEFFSTHVYLVEHQESVLGEREFTCEVCDKSLLTRAHLKRHTMNHKKSPSCSSCKETFCSEGELKEHLSNRCESLKCKICDKSFSHIGALKAHAKTHGKSVGENTVCVTCSQVFSSLQEYQEHARSHQTQSSFECTECGKLFSRNKALKRHRLVHTSGSKFSCAICNKAFKTKHHMERHSKIHSRDIEGIACPRCEKSFRSEAQLKRHLSEHKDYGSKSRPRSPRKIGQTGSVARDKRAANPVSSRSRLPVESQKSLEPKSRVTTDVKSIAQATLRSRGSASCGTSNLTQGKFRCDGCRKTFSSSRDLRIHRREHAK